MGSKGVWVVCVVLLGACGRSSSTAAPPTMDAGSATTAAGRATSSPEAVPADASPETAAPADATPVTAAPADATPGMAATDPGREDPAALLGAGADGRTILDARRCAETTLCKAAALAVDRSGASPVVGLLVVPAEPAAPAAGARWIELLPGDGARWLAPVDLDAGSLGAGEASVDLAVLPEGAELRFPTRAKVPAFVVRTTASSGVSVGSDAGVTEALVVVAQLRGVLRRVLAAALRGAEADGQAFSPIGGLGLHRGTGRLLEIGWVEHVTPGPRTQPYRPGPPLQVRYRYAGTEYRR